MRRRNQTALLCGAVLTGLSSAGIVNAQELFTTASDWTVYNSALTATAGANNGWLGGAPPATSALLDTPLADLDGNLINGLGNINTATGISAAGLPGGSGGLQVTSPAGGGYLQMTSPEESSVPATSATKTPNSNFFTALATPTLSYLALDFSINNAAAYTYPSTSYVQPGFVINDNVDGYDNLGGQVNITDRTPSGGVRIVGTSGANQVVYDGINSAGNPQYTLLMTDPFSGSTPTLTLAAGDTYSYFQLLIIMNTNYAGVFDVDNLRIVPVPEPASLGLLGLGAPALLLRHRKRV
jgi:hypothetical protein